MSGFEPVVEGVLAVLGILVVLYLVYYAALITLYVLGSLGLYTVAKRREIKHPWMAWLPVLSFWTLGSISDQYQYVVKGRIRNRRKLMIGLAIVQMVLAVVIYVVYFVAYFKLILEIGMNAELMDDNQVMQMLLSTVMPMVIIALVSGIVGIVLTVFQYICYFDLFRSCDPDNRVLYLVLSIIFSFLLPIFTFVCRKKDLGMPPRTDAPVAYIPQQPAEPWVQPQQTWSQPQEPWNQPPESENE